MVPKMVRATVSPDERFSVFIFFIDAEVHTCAIRVHTRVYAACALYVCPIVPSHRLNKQLPRSAIISATHTLTVCENAFLID